MTRSSDSPSRIRGRAVLRSPAAKVVAAFWAIGLVIYLVPGPFGEILRRKPDPAQARQGSTPAIPGVPVRSASAAVRGTGAPPPPGGASGAERSGDTSSVGQPIEDPHGSLAHFARALAGARKGRGAPVRVLHYGDSQLDLDHISGTLRKRFQARYGDGGFGFTPLLKPWRWFYQVGVMHQASGGWTLHRLATRSLQDGRLGLGLSAAERRGKGWLRVVFRRPATRVELSFLAQPGGGSVYVYLAGRKLRRVVTGSDDGYHAGFAAFALPATEKQHIVHVQTSGKVRLFGLTFERAGGVTWENLPMLSARFHRLAALSGPIWKQQLAHASPALVVFQFGANDAISYGGDIERYRQAIERVLAWRAQAVPQGGCLIIGPLDQLVRRGGKLVVRPTLERVLGAQRQAALARGCAFWDARAAMGGPGALARWAARGMLRADQVHLSNKGSRELARLLYAALERELKRHRTHRPPSQGRR